MRHTFTSAGSMPAQARARQELPPGSAWAQFGPGAE
jgi:hypothetical protein